MSQLPTTPDMSVIIRLQNLPWSANSLDIRQFFGGLSIPEGGVHIVGGEVGDAFIAFSTDEDARQAMMMGGGKIKEVQITLMLSSRTEMQKVIEAARIRSLTLLVAPQAATPVTQPPIHPSDMNDNMAQPRRDSRDDKKELSDEGRRDRKDRSRSRSRDRGRRDRRRRSRSRSRSRDRRRRRSRSRSRDRKAREVKGNRRDGSEQSPDMTNKGIQPGNQVWTTSSVMQRGNPAMNPVAALNAAGLNPAALNPAALNPAALNPALLNQLPLLNNLAPFGLLGNFPAGMNMARQQQQVVQQQRQDRDNIMDRFPRDDNTRNMNQGDNFRGDATQGGNFRDNDIRNMNFRDSDSRNFGMVGGQGRGGDFGDRDTRGGHNADFNNRNNNQRNSNSDLNNQGNNQRNNNNADLNNRGNRHNNPDFNNRGNNMDFNNRNNNGRNSFQNSRFDNREQYNSRKPGQANSDDERRNPRRRWENPDVDKFGRSLNLRDKNNTDPFRDGQGDEDDDNYQEQQGQTNYPGFTTRFMPNQQVNRERESWPPNRTAPDTNEQRSYRNQENFRDDSRPRDKFRGEEERVRPTSKILDKDTCIEIPNLERNVSYGDVRRGFSYYKVVITDIKFITDGEQKRALIKCLDSENKKRALNLTNKVSITGKTVRVLHMNNADFEVALPDGRKPEEPDAADDKVEGHLLIKDVPSSANEADVKRILSGLNVVTVVLVDTPTGKRAYVLLKTNTDAKTALKWRSRPIGKIDVMITPCTKTEFDEVSKPVSGPQPVVVVEKPVKEEPVPVAKAAEPAVVPPLLPLPTVFMSDCIIMKNLPGHANDRDICDFFSDVGLVPTKIHIMLDVEGQPSGDAFCEFASPHQATLACNKNNSHLGKNTVVVQLVQRKEMVATLGRVNGPAPQMNMNMGPRMNPDMRQGPHHGMMGPGPGPGPGFGPGPMGPMPFNPPPCVVALENVPFRATTEDIMSFFDWNYHVSENDVMRRYNERGHTTGDARVTLRSPDDAMRAVNTLNGKRIHERPVRLYIL